MKERFMRSAHVQFPWMIHRHRSIQKSKYKDYEELLNDPQVDAVYIALTHKFHKEWISKIIGTPYPQY